MGLSLWLLTVIAVFEQFVAGQHGSLMLRGVRPMPMSPVSLNRLVKRSSSVCTGNNTVICDSACCPPQYTCVVDEGYCCPASAPQYCGLKSDICCPTTSVCGISSDGVACLARCSEGLIQCGSNCCPNGTQCIQNSDMASCVTTSTTVSTISCLLC
jgi:hypothetical protein